MERTLVLIKPDGFQRRLVGEIIGRLERKGLQLIGIKMMHLTDEILRIHYAHLSEKPFFAEIASFMKQCPVVVTCWAGLEAVSTVRLICGITKARGASPGTIRGDLAMSVQANVVHASDSVEAGKIEVERFFSPSELFTIPDHSAEYIYSAGERNSG
jgi:nucleoside-diphosphate kinase